MRDLHPPFWRAELALPEDMEIHPVWLWRWAPRGDVLAMRCSTGDSGSRQQHILVMTCSVSSCEYLIVSLCDFVEHPLEHEISRIIEWSASGLLPVLVAHREQGLAETWAFCFLDADGTLCHRIDLPELAHKAYLAAPLRTQGCSPDSSKIVLCGGTSDDSAIWLCEVTGSQTACRRIFYRPAQYGLQPKFCVCSLAWDPSSTRLLLCSYGAIGSFGAEVAIWNGETFKPQMLACTARGGAVWSAKGMPCWTTSF